MNLSLCSSDESIGSSETVDHSDLATKLMLTPLDRSEQNNHVDMSVFLHHEYLCHSPVLSHNTVNERKYEAIPHSLRDVTQIITLYQSWAVFVLREHVVKPVGSTFVQRYSFKTS